MADGVVKRMKRLPQQSAAAERRSRAPQQSAAAEPRPLLLTRSEEPFRKEMVALLLEGRAAALEAPLWRSRSGGAALEEPLWRSRSGGAARLHNKRLFDSRAAASRCMGCISLVDLCQRADRKRRGFGSQMATRSRTLEVAS
ncbi:hypothetical protein EYF80_017833 [Liparis tanakae]|uniref:Uncharacterized protein n=1 Tax=Liparis tanakae TaxID=230148 RepID=A0A4Z2I3J8_9TELE|nr:hypothetical protein EYF80_017833 [Liparis tanakae]